MVKGVHERNELNANGTESRPENFSRKTFLIHDWATHHLLANASFPKGTSIDWRRGSSVGTWQNCMKPVTHCNKNANFPTKLVKIFFKIREASSQLPNQKIINLIKFYIEVKGTN